MRYLIAILVLIPVAVFGQEAATAHAADYIGIVERVLALFGAGGVLAMFIPPKVRATIPIVNTVLRIIRLEFLGQKNGAPDQPKALEFGK